MATDLDTAEDATIASGGQTWFFAPHSDDARGIADIHLFRAVVDVGQPQPTSLTIAADSRYKLRVNGELLSVGPAKPRRSAWFFDEVAIGHALRPGPNAITIEVLSYRSNEHGNFSVRRRSSPALHVTGVAGDTDLAAVDAWRVTRLPVTVSQGLYTVFLGIQEETEGNAVAADFHYPEADDSHWKTPRAAVGHPGFPAAAPAPLFNRPTAPLSLEDVNFVGVTAREGDLDPTPLLRGEPLVIPAGRRIVLDFDAGVLLTAQLSFKAHGPENTRFEILAAECYELEPIFAPWARRKGDRSDSRNGDLYGDADIYTFADAGQHHYEPFWYRTLRYLRITVEPASAPVTLTPPRLTRIQADFTVTGSFHSDLPLDTRLWEVSERTLRACMHDTFEDCPYYEQLQYAMDTRSQALFALHLGQDDRMVRRAIEDFADSGEFDGLVEARSPSAGAPQYIPGFALYWVFMIADHLMLRADRAFSRRFLPRIDAVFAAYERAVTKDGFVAFTGEEYWNFVDWTSQWNESRGVPVVRHDGASTILTLMYSVALTNAALIAQECDEQAKAEAYAARAAELADVALEGSIDPATGLYADAPGGLPESVHAQVWAVLTGRLTKTAAADLLRLALDNPALAACSYAMALPQIQALEQAGLSDLVDWSPWSEMLDHNLTTWAEDTTSLRSDCHAWGAVPLLYFPRYVLGAVPLEPGWSRVSVAPRLGNRSKAAGVIPTPHGELQISCERRGQKTYVQVTAPMAISVEIPSDAVSGHPAPEPGSMRPIAFTLDRGAE
ncbi:alpha-L-rhamnosidase-related protein [Paenarthrobacter sp. 22069]|uniref:alpha-L-rhamnosidase-related protein n=1 Tax=Paenarthrobacter sp. 22069 TaxID=3453864 RepID=UPI003F8519E9